MRCTPSQCFDSLKRMSHSVFKASKASASSHLTRSSAAVPFTPVKPGKGLQNGTGALKQAWSAVEYQEMRLRRLMMSCSGPATAAPATDAAPAAPEVPLVTAMDIRVGKILKCERHPDADSLYVEEIDVGEPEPRTIVSGLVKYVPLEAMQDRKLLVLCNLKPRNMRGIKSNGMVLCASNDAHDCVEPLAPPADAPVGERVWFGNEGKSQPAPAEPNRVQKKKIWEEVQPLLKTDGNKVANFKGLEMLTSAGPVTADTLVNANIS